MRGLDGAAIGKLASDAGDCGAFGRERRVGINEVSSCPGVEDSRGFSRGGSII